MTEECRSYLALVLCFVMATSPLQAPAVASGTAVKARVAGERWSDGHPSQLNTILRDASHSPRRGPSILHNTKEDLVRSASLYSGVQSGAIQAASQIVAASLPGQTATLMPDGRRLLLGGRGNNGPLAAAFFKNPKTGVVTQLPSGLLHARYSHTASILPDGTVLIFGGIGVANKAEQTAELFGPQSLKFAVLPTRGMTPRSSHTATLLTDGRVLIAGGVSADGEVLSKIEFWDWKKSTASSSAAELITARQGHTASLQADGTVLFWGGKDRNGTPLNYGEIYDPVSQHVQMQANPLPEESSVPPLVEASIPQDGDQNVALDISVAVRFSKPLQVETVNLNTATLAGPEASNVVVKVVPAEAGMLAFVTPQNTLLPGTGYTLTLSGATDPSGLALADTTVTFTTAGGNSGSGAPGTGDSGGNPFNSSWRNLAPLHAPPGVTALAGQVLQLNGQPLPNVTLQIGNFRSRSDATGRFLVINIPAGHQVMWIVGDSANQRGATYGIYEDGVDITAKQTNVLKYTIWLTALDTAHTVTIPSPTLSETVVSNPLLPGLELHLSVGTVIHDWYGKVVTQINITPIPVAQPPFPLPAGVQVPIYFTIQPGGAYLQGYDQNSKSAGARLFYPNTYHLPAGNRFNFWNYDADQKGWYVYGEGSVSSDTRQIIPDPGVVIYEFTGAMVGGKQNAPSLNPPPGGPRGGEPVDLQTGLFVYTKTDLYLPDVIPIQLTRTYRQMDSTSRTFGIGTTLDYDMFIVGDAYTYINQVGADGGQVHFDRVSPGTSFSDAAYQHSGIPAAYGGAQITWNGNGWTLTRKDGTKYVFPESASYLGPRQGALTKIIDRNGNTLTLTRDSNSNLTQISSPNGRWIQLTYDSNNRVTQATDNIGRTVLYTYYASGELATVTDANGGLTTYTYDSSHNMTAVQDARQILYLTNHYDGNNRVDRQTLVDGSTYQFSYVNAGGTSICGGNCPLSGSNIVETDVTDPRGYVRKVTFNSDGYVVSDTHALGKPEEQTITYNRQPTSGLVMGVTDSLSRQTSYTYDAKANVTSVTALAGTGNAATTSLSYELTFSKVTAVTDPLGHTTSFAYDSNGNRTSITDPPGNAATASYNTAGQPLSITDPSGNTVQLAYNAGDLVGITDPLSHTVMGFVDAAGRLASVTDPAGQSTQFVYNPMNRVSSVTDPKGNQTGFGWDPNGNLLSVTDANQHATTYTYDNMDRVATRKDPLLVQESYQYDGNGNLTQFTDRRGKVTAFNYDGLNRLTFAGFGTVAGPAYESTVNYSYDAGDRPTSVVDSVSGTITLVFDDLDRLKSETTPQGNVTYQYDSAGRESSMTVAGQPAVTYTYDNADRLTQITQGSSNVTFGHNAAGRRTSLTLPNGVTAAYGYDNASQLASLTYQGGSSLLGNLTYAYDQSGRVAQMGGNYARTGLPTAIPSAAYDAANRLTNWAGNSYAYDANGNLASDTINTYTWDARNQLASISGGVSASFQYDPFGRRINKTIAGVTTGFLYDGVNVVQELSGSTPTANLLTGGIDEIFTRTDSSTRNFLTDALGSTAALTDSTSAVATQYTFEPFGNTASSGSTSSNAFQYTGRENDGIGLYFYRARYYGPKIQRFISQDPIGFGGGDTNLYAYSFNNPTNFTDPSGRGPELALPWIGACLADPPCAALLLGTGLLLAYYASKARGLPFPDTATPDPGRAPSVDPGKKNDPCGVRAGGALPVPRWWPDPTQSLGPEWTWRGSGPPGSVQGAWWNPNTGQSMHPDFNNPAHDPHYDYSRRGFPDEDQRVYPDRTEPKCR